MPRQRVPNLAASILDAGEQSVVGPIAREREQVAARFQHPFRRARPVFAPLLILLRLELVPVAAHEREAIRRVGHDRVDTLSRQFLQHVETVPGLDGVGQVSHTNQKL